MTFYSDVCPSCQVLYFAQTMHNMDGEGNKNSQAIERLQCPVSVNVKATLNAE